MKTFIYCLLTKKITCSIIILDQEKKNKKEMVKMKIEIKYDSLVYHAILSINNFKKNKNTTTIIFKEYNKTLRENKIYFDFKYFNVLVEGVKLLRKGQTLLSVKTYAKYEPHIREAYRKAQQTSKSCGCSPEAVSRLLYTASGREKIYMQCFAFFSPEDFPTHSLFVNYLRAKPLPEEEDFKGLQEVADILELWCGGGKNGKLFDGMTNIKLDGDFEYFELSSVPDNDPHFKFVVGALIQMLAMSKIESLPRNLKKRFIIDEANSFFEIPQGAKVIESAMTKYRKHRCSVLISFQQYEMLNNKDIKESVLSNIHQYILLGQSDRGDVERLGEALGLSGAIKEAVLNFETPANLPIKERYAAFAQVTKKDGLTAGIGRNYLTTKMITMLSGN
jgi:hypothetical protein